MELLTFRTQHVTLLESGKHDVLFKVENDNIVLIYCFSIYILYFYP